MKGSYVFTNYFQMNSQYTKTDDRVFPNIPCGSYLTDGQQGVYRDTSGNFWYVCNNVICDPLDTYYKNTRCGYKFKLYSNQLPETPKHSTAVDTAKGTDTMKQSMERWWERNSNIVITVAVIFLVDHLVFKGSMRKKIESIFDKLVNRAENEIEKKEQGEVNLTIPKCKVVGVVSTAL